ncbi:MAG: hypothetical protein H0U11_07235, partial [Chloroflexi bacterium]|nr:hypothetical protein [Chloroflexota bacterium]
MVVSGTAASSGTEVTDIGSAAEGARESAKPRSATPRSPATRDLGMKVSLLFPDREVAEKYYLPL